MGPSLSNGRGGGQSARFPSLSLWALWEREGPRSGRGRGKGYSFASRNFSNLRLPSAMENSAVRFKATPLGWNTISLP
jgi:hypothetical protein